MSPTTPEASAATAAPDTKPNKVAGLPKSQLALATLGVAAAKAWQTSELPALLFVTKAAFSTQAAAYAASLGTADAVGDGTSPQSSRLKTLDKLITKNLKFVKGYLAEDHDEDGGEAYYAEFGIVREGKNFRLPTARTARAGALGKLVAALTAHQYDKKKFGSAFWQPIATEYAQLAKGSGELRGAASEAVGQKNTLEAPLRVVLGALVLSIRANYPDEDTQRGVLRAFGFQKEVY
ncbi:hypothetical protein GCM10022409_21670 [Hymenobacter glaciei]|uniref:Uncharacterized protein n=1 Tax=Hymenobacter glaciei TaxID=877209 RepID=A0ABP7U5K3_9BACT